MPITEHPANLEEFLALINNDKLVVVDFFADWCGPCRMVAPKLEEFSNTYTDAIFAKVDVDNAQDVSHEMGVRAMPTFMFFKSGQKLDEVVGAKIVEIENMIKSHI